MKESDLHCCVTHSITVFKVIIILNCNTEKMRVTNTVVPLIGCQYHCVIAIQVYWEKVEYIEED